MLCLYNLAVRGLQMQCNCLPALKERRSTTAAGVKGPRTTEFPMEALSSYTGDETNCLGSIEEEGEEDSEEEEENEQEQEEEDEQEDDTKEPRKDESVVQGPQRSAWSAGVGFFQSTFKEVYSYVGEDIVIEEGLDSFAGMIWPGARALCHYLDTHQEQVSLVDKAVLEIGAGTGLVSVVASLLGAWVTATDLPDVLGNLRRNLSRNTRGRCRHTPQVAALCWGSDLESTYPRSVYHYDYVLAADVVYHHDFLSELLVTMKHFCQPGTTVIWANKVRFQTDLTFTENFHKAFHTSVLDDGEINIFMATCKSEEEEKEEEEKGEVEEEVDIEMDVRDQQGQEEEREEAEDEKSSWGKNVPELQSDNTEKSQTKENSKSSMEELHSSKATREEGEGQTCGTLEKRLEVITSEDDGCKGSLPGSDSITEAQTSSSQPAAWLPRSTDVFGRDIYHYVGHDISIRESIDCFGAVMWPAALALCSFLDNNRQRVNLQDKKVLELGGGTGLVAVVAALLGASVTATDLPEVLGNLEANVMRNTRGRCRHTPQVAALCWGSDLESAYPRSVYRYDYVLAADVVFHHDFLSELLATMKHFCQPGTTVIWANKVRLETDLTFTENFHKAFHTSVLDDGEIKIFMATCRE
ncbi:uncharacterized protein mettl21ca isoform X2 [Nelusetta ayraudi]|uniref:uncharacterized protein mettl21ca isoform X2 n=1 Tax=Nelusetta ayraudi TaxID=303726 RepID=UPI003F6EC50B